jgi:hypothetical protein
MLHVWQIKRVKVELLRNTVQLVQQTANGLMLELAVFHCLAGM